MKIQCTDAHNAKAIAHHAAQYRYQDYGVCISAEDNTLNVSPSNSNIQLLSIAFSKLSSLLLDHPKRETPKQQSVCGDITTS